MFALLLQSRHEPLGAARPARARAEGGAPEAREFLLYAPNGRPEGVIPAPAQRPVFGPGAPAVYLRRLIPAA